MAGWLGWLEALRRRIVRRQPEPTAAPSVQPDQAQPDVSISPTSSQTRGGGSTPGEFQNLAASQPQPPVAINLGIDFGTSFTKVCFRDEALEHSGLVPVGVGRDGLLTPSIVYVDGTGKLHLDPPASGSAKTVRYLKMRLAGVPLDGLLPSDFGEADNGDVCKALSSWFLATVIARSKASITRLQADRLRNRKVDWSANVGVPVEHFDSPLLKTFEEVLKVSWAWIKAESIPDTIEKALEGYESARGHAGASDFHAVPEIAAAVQSFVISQAAAPGVYLYFDVGGGTVDGVAFRLQMIDGQKHVDFYSGRVSPLGTIALARRLEPDFESTLPNRGFSDLLAANPSEVETFEHQMRLLVGYVVMTAKKKDGRNWKDEAIQQWVAMRNVRTLGRPALEKPLVVFIGGGGANIDWYSQSIMTTYARFQHANAGIPPYEVRRLSKPADFTMSGADQKLFDRFSIAYGLSIPMGTGPDIRLPSQFEPLPKNEPRRPPGLLDYLLYSKDT